MLNFARMTTRICTKYEPSWYGQRICPSVATVLKAYIGRVVTAAPRAEPAAAWRMHGAASRAQRSFAQAVPQTRVIYLARNQLAHEWKKPPRRGTSAYFDEVVGIPRDIKGILRLSSSPRSIGLSSPQAFVCKHFS